MSLTLHTVDNGTVAAINDAKFYEQLTNAVAGVVAGGVCSAAGGLIVHITSGWGIIKGRLFTIDAEDINVEPSASGTVNGRLKMVIDLTATPNIYFESERARTLPSLVQEDLNAGGTVYELALRTYSVGELAVSDLVSNTAVSIAPAAAAALASYVPTSRTVNGNALTGDVTVTRDQVSGIVKSNTISSKTLNMSLSGTTLTITYQ